MVRITDMQIIDLLERDARTPASHIAEELGVTETAIRKRMAKLQEKKIVTQHTIRVSPRKSDFLIVFVGIYTKAESYRKISNELKEKSYVKRMYSTSGDHHLQLECWFTSNEEFHESLHKHEKNPEITKICPGIAQEQIK